MQIQYNQKIPIIIKAIQILYDLPGCQAGGCCHIVTSDNNIDDDSLRFVIDFCNRPENCDMIDKELSKMICELLLQLSLEQRVVLIMMYSPDYYYAELDETIWNEYTKYIREETIHEIIKELCG